MKTLCAIVICCAALIATVTTQVGHHPQGWSLKPTTSLDRVHLSIKHTRLNGTVYIGTDVPVSALRGFSVDQFAHGGSAHFEMVRDAGKFIFDGGFSWGTGTGDFRFEPNSDYIAELVKMGYEAPAPDQLFGMMLSDVNLIFARNIRSEDIGATTKDLIELRNHGITFDYIHEARQAGFRDLRTRDFVDLRNHGVKVDFMREVRAAGYDISTRQLIDLRNHGIGADYLRDVQRAGVHPEVRDLIHFKNHGVTPGYLKVLQETGYTDVTPQQVTDLRNHGVPEKFITEAKDLGYQFTPRELIHLKNHGVNAEYLRKLRETGMRDLDAAQISKLRQHGVE